MKSLIVLVFALFLLSGFAAAQDEILGTNGDRERQPGTPDAERVVFYGAIGALWAATALDIYSGESLDKRRFRETNPMGSPAGQIVTSGIATGAAIILRRYGSKRLQWLATALLVGGAAGHAYGAVNNFALR